MKKKRVVYYKDEMNDEFSSAVITPRKIDGAYRYERDGFFGKMAHFFFYRIVAVPLAFVYLKIKFSHKIIGREKLKQAVGRPCFVYGNHTQPTADALIPTFVTHPRDAFVIVHPANVSMPVLGRITPYIGALPLPDNMEAARNFARVIEKRTGEKKPIFIYPEAHIWPYYTGIRPFSEQSFCYPIKYRTPVFCFTNVYKKRKFGVPRIETYVDGPFYADETLPHAERKKALRDAVYDKMKERSLLSDTEYIEYRKESGI